MNIEPNEIKPLCLPNLFNYIT